jgi:hypothetical protein
LTAAVASKLGKPAKRGGLSRAQQAEEKHRMRVHASTVAAAADTRADKADEGAGGGGGAHRRASLSRRASVSRVAAARRAGQLTSDFVVVEGDEVRDDAHHFFPPRQSGVVKTWLTVNLSWKMCQSILGHGVFCLFTLLLKEMRVVR